MEFEGGVFRHPQAVIEFAYTLVKEYEEHERQQDAAVTHVNLWHKMKSKCNNKSGWFYSKYGARGIKVCDRWNTSLDNFVEDMGPIPNGVVGIERLNKKEHFNPENTVWKYYQS